MRQKENKPQSKELTYKVCDALQIDNINLVPLAKYESDYYY